MNLDTWPRIKEALSALLESPTPEVDLKRLNDLEPEIAQDVARLFHQRKSLGSFLEPSQPANDPLLDELQATLGQDFEGFDRVGEGGSSAVYRARQLKPVTRDVAIKIMDQRTLNPALRARFQLERDALATLNHPGIAVIHTAGESRTGQLYLVMEWIEGLPITEFCDVGKLSIRQRLDLFVQVTHAVQFAHQNGILHRDLKPSNILVTETAEGPRAKVIDFGIATRLQATPKERVTLEMSGFPGTLAYIPPERLNHPNAPPNTQTDVYALGVVLFELLVGLRPFEEHSNIALAQAIMHRDPPRPSRALGQHTDREQMAQTRGCTFEALTKQLHLDLDWIILRCIEPDTSQRYASVTEISADLQRESKGEPVSARPFHWSYLARKFIRRHKAFVMAGVFMIAMLLISSFGFYNLFRKSEAARVRELAARQTAEAETKRAQTISQFLEDMLRSPDPARLGSNAKIVDFLDHSAEGLESRLQDDPVVLANIHISLGDTYLNLAEFDKAERHYLTALELQGSNPETKVRMLNKLGRHAIYTTHYPQARTYLELAQALTFQPDWQDMGLRYGVAYNLAIVAEETGDLAAASQQLAELSPLLEKLVPYDPSLHLGSLSSLARINAELGRLDESETVLRQVLARQNEVFGAQHPDTLTTLFDLAKILRKQNRFEEAETLQRQELQLSTQVLGQKHPETLVSMEGLVRNLIRQGKYEEAAPLSQQCYHWFLEVLGEDHAFTPYAVINQACIVGALGNHKQAMDLFEQAISGVSDRPTLSVKFQTQYLTFLEDANYRQEADQLRAILCARASDFPDQDPEWVNPCVFTNP